MKTRLTPRLLLLATLLLFFLRGRADAPRFPYPLLQLAGMAHTITETDLTVYTKAFAEQKSAALSENALYLKGIETGVLASHDEEVKEVLLKVSAGATFSPLGAKVYQFHIRYNKSTALAQNAILIIPGDEVNAFRARLKEVIDLVDKKKSAQCWKWVLAGLTSPNPLIREDAVLTVYYTMDGEKYIFDHYENRPIAYINHGKGLDIKEFPNSSKEALANIIAQTVSTGSVDVIRHPLISLGYALQVPGFSDICLKAAVNALEIAERIEKTPHAQGEAESSSRNNVEMALTLARMALTYPASSLEQQQRAARLLIFTQRWQAHYKRMADFPANGHPEHKQYLPALAAFLGGSDLQADATDLAATLHSAWKGDADPRREHLTEAALALNKLAASRIDMCGDPAIDQLTGNRNWWGCHKVEGPETFVLANTQATAAGKEVTISVAPNPIREGRCTVEWGVESEATSVTLLLMDGSGRQVWSRKHELTRYTSVQQAVIELPASIAVGVYGLIVQYPDRQLEVKVVVE